jgi:ATP-binding cassette subfamily B protein
MKLRSPLPPDLLAALAAEGLAPDGVVFALESDINLVGAYAPQWVVAARDTLWVFAADRADRPLLKLALGECEEFRTAAVYGSGLLQVKVGGVWLDVVRYSNSLKYHVGRLAKRLEQLRKGAVPELTAEDDTDPRRCPLSGVVLEYAGQISPFAVRRSAALSRIALLMRPYWRSAALMMAVLICGVTLDMITPRLIQYLIDHVLDPKAAGKPQPFAWLDQVTQPLHLLLLVVGAVALAQGSRALLYVVNGRIASRVGTAISFDIRTRLVEHLEKLSLSYYDKQSVGSLVGRVAYDTEAVQGFMGQLTAGFLMQILMVILAGVAMYGLEPRLAVWTLVPAPFVIAGTFIFYRFVYPHYQRFWDRSSRQAGMLNGILSGIRVVKAFAQEERELQRFRDSSRTLRDARLRVDTSAATFYPMMGLVFGVGGWIVWYIGGKAVLGNNADPAHGISLGTLMAFFGYLGLFYGPLSGLTNLTSWLTQFSTQMTRIFEVLDAPVSIPDSRQPVAMPELRGEIEFQGVSFGYNRLSPILKGVSFHIAPGQMIGVVGRSGSGKTTIINLISRFYDIDEGRILIDGVEIREVAKQDLRRHVGVVLQEPFLFRGTLHENLVYGRTDATVEQAIAASRAGNAHDFIMRQMQAYDTWVGERGSGLSGGERQRLSIARALLCEPRILILDEATSSVDSESELAIQTALAELVKGRTSIIIAHRLSTLRNCDRILVVDNGLIAEQGSHQELMAKDGRYARLVRIQGNANAEEGSIDSLAHQERARQDAATVAAQVADPLTGLSPIAGHRPRWLQPQHMRIWRDERQNLHLEIAGERDYSGVFALRCMPVRHPERYISLRWVVEDDREQEIGLINDLAQWPAEAQRLVREALMRRYLLHTILRVLAVREEHHYLMFSVVTDHGPREFTMRWAGETALEYGERGKVLQDVEENRYLVPDVAALPTADRLAFERYIFW